MCFKGVTLDAVWSISCNGEAAESPQRLVESRRRRVVLWTSSSWGGEKCFLNLEFIGMSDVSELITGVLYIIA